MARLAILIDAAYLERVAADNFRTGIDYTHLPDAVRDIVAGGLREPLDIVRTYLYDALPHLPAGPSDDDSKKHAEKARFFDFVRNQPRFVVREGWVAFRGRDRRGRPFYQQKQVDMLLGLDIALLSAKRQISHMAIISGDSDLTPAIEVARDEGVTVWLFHGPRVKETNQSSVARSLLQSVDMRYEIDQEFMNRVERQRRG